MDQTLGDLNGPDRTILFAFVAFVLFTVVDPFGLATVTSRASQQFAYRALSLFQPQAGAEHIAVVLIDDASVSDANSEGGYPISFRHHASLLRPVLCAGPASVFMDITFRGLRGDPGSGAEPNETIAPLLAGLAQRPRPGDPYCTLPSGDGVFAVEDPRIFLARTFSHPPHPCDPLFGRTLPEQCRTGRALDQLADVTFPISVTRVADDGSYLLASEYPGQRLGAASVPGRLEPSPALAMVFAFCDAAQGTARADLPGCRDRAKLAALLNPDTPREARTLHPVWSFYRTRGFLADRAAYSAADAGQAQGACAEAQNNPSPTLVSRFSLIAFEFWKNLLTFGATRDTGVFGGTLCLPADALNARAVRTLNTSASDQSRERLQKFFSGRMVFYGVDITGINDSVSSPVLGLVPGAAFHAAVAENLVNKGADFRRSPSTIVEFGGHPLLNTAQLLDIAVFFVVGGVLYWVRVAQGRTWFRGLASVGHGLVLAIGAASLGLAVIAGLSGVALVVAVVGLAIYAGLALGHLLRWHADVQPWTWLRQQMTTVAIALLLAGILGAIVASLLQLPPTNFLATAILVAQISLDR